MTQVLSRKSRPSDFQGNPVPVHVRNNEQKLRQPCQCRCPRCSCNSPARPEYQTPIEDCIYHIGYHPNPNPRCQSMLRLQMLGQGFEKIIRKQTGNQPIRKLSRCIGQCRILSEQMHRRPAEGDDPRQCECDYEHDHERIARPNGKTIKHTCPVRLGEQRVRRRHESEHGRIPQVEPDSGEGGGRQFFFSQLADEANAHDWQGVLKDLRKDDGVG
mmetsp:Transcript_40577/g.85175  ORF Transcript_40577/g.85175 Transcript_40577/m.85175 type:complete len:215 (-) Transcript_40577:257-901(-)